MPDYAPAGGAHPPAPTRMPDYATDGDGRGTGRVGMPTLRRSEAPVDPSVLLRSLPERDENQGWQPSEVSQKASPRFAVGVTLGFEFWLGGRAPAPERRDNAR